MVYTYCPTCGTKLIEKEAGDDGLTPYCSSCQRFWFPTFADCVIVLVADEFDDVALVKMPYLSTDYKSLISGYMKPGETAEQAAIREVDEELGISLDHVAYAGTYWFSKTETLMHGYTAVTSKQPLTKSAELAVADWIPKQDVLQQMFPDSPDNAAVAIFKQYFASTK